MDRRVISLCLSLSLMLLFAGCASKKVASSSGDQSGQAKTEAIQPDAIKTVPQERSFDRPSGSPPSNLSVALEYSFRQQCIRRRVLRLRPVSNPQGCHAGVGRQ